MDQAVKEHQAQVKVPKKVFFKPPKPLIIGP